MRHLDNIKKMKKLILVLLFLIPVIGYAQSTGSQLTTQAQVIRDETEAGANTKTRIYNMFKAIIDSKYNLTDHDSDDITEGVTNKFITQAELDKLAGIESGATGDQTGIEIIASIDGEIGTSWKSGLTEEEVEDIVNGLMVGGTGITATYDDVANTLTLSIDYTDLDTRYYTESEVDVITGQLAPIARAIPSGGSSGQVLKKSSSTDYDVVWGSDNTGGGGGGSAALGVVHIDGDTTINGWDLQSNTRYVGSNGAVITVNNLVNQGGMVINGDSNIVIENVIIDLNTDNDVGAGNGDANNFATCITIRDAKNIRILNSQFINSNRANADPDWTLHAIEAQNTDVLHVVNNRSYGCQFKLDGAAGSLTNVLFDNNYVKECTQMGVSFVVQPAGANVELRNINITNNIFEDIDNHAIYGGNDNGAGAYTGTVVMENINITGNQIKGLAYLSSSQQSKGILMNITKDTRFLNISENHIIGQAANTSVQGININTASQDASSNLKGYGITVSNNKIYDTGSFSVFLTDVGNFQLKDNFIEDGRGIRLLNCADGQVFGNIAGASVEAMFRFDTSDNIISDKPYADDAAALADGLSNGDFYFKSGAGYVAIGGSLASTLTQEQVEDFTGGQFNHLNHTNVTATYDDASGEVRLTADVSAAPSGDSYIDQIWQTPAQYEDTLGVTLGALSQTNTNYVTVDEIIGQPGFADLAALKTFFDDVPEVTSATAVTDLDRGGTGDAQGVSLDYAVLRQMFENSYNFVFPAQVNYKISHDLSIKEGGVYRGAVNRDDVNATKFSQVAGCDCNIFASKNIVENNTNWHLSGGIYDISFEGDTLTNSAGSGVWIKNMGENYAVYNIRSNRFPEHGIRVSGKYAPVQIWQPSVHGNKIDGVHFEADSLENSEKEIVIYGPTGDNNGNALIGIDASYTRTTVINPKAEGSSKYMIDINKGSGTRLLVIGGAWGAYDKFTASNCTICESVINLNYTYPESGFNNPVVRVMNFGFDDIPHALINQVTADTFDINNNETYLDWVYTRWADNIVPFSQYETGLPFYGAWEGLDGGSAYQFRNGRVYTHESTSTMYFNNYTDWQMDSKVVVYVTAASQPSLSFTGTVPGPGTAYYSGETFIPNQKQRWTITYGGDGEYFVNIQ